MLSTSRSMKAPANPALFHEVVRMRVYDSEKDSVGKLTKALSLSRDYRVAHLRQHDLRKPLPPSRVTQRINTQQ